MNISASSILSKPLCNPQGWISVPESVNIDQFVRSKSEDFFDDTILQQASVQSLCLYLRTKACLSEMIVCDFLDEKAKKYPCFTVMERKLRRQIPMSMSTEAVDYF